MVNSRDDDFGTAAGKAMTDNVLVQRQQIAGSAESAGESSPQRQPSSPQPHHTRYNNKYRYKSSIRYQKLTWISRGTLAMALAMTARIIMYGILNGENAPNSYFRCSPLLRSSSSSESQSNIILMASHLRQGSDGKLRLRIIEHNLHFLLSRTKNYEFQLENNGNTKPIKSILIFSLDQNNNGASVIHDMVDEWRNSLHPTISSKIARVQFVPNNAILVDVSKWIHALQDILPEIQSTNARVMLMNDSFLLTRPVPELWNDNSNDNHNHNRGASDNDNHDGAAVSCGKAEVCGLVWTAPPSDPTRHIQSYIRTLSSCAVERYMAFYRENMGKLHNVHELIILFEIDLEWARRGRRPRWFGGSSSDGGNDGNVGALYGYAGAHPDADGAQKILISKGYPAIKLKKFFVTNDPWLSQDEATRPRLPSSFSKSIYKQMNHDLNHLGDSDLEKHFARYGKNEERIYSRLPLVIKGWLKEELLRMHEHEKMGGYNGGEDEDAVVGVDSTISILEDYLAALNTAIANIE